MEQRLESALAELNRLLEKASEELHASIQFALIGGLAVAAWGVIRATQDIDVLANSDPTPLVDTKLRGNLKEFLERNNCDAEWRKGDADDPIPLLLRINLPPTYGGVGADILWAHKRWQQEALQRSVTVKVSNSRVYVLHPEDLILMKLDAGGPQDLLDIQQMLSASPPQLSIERLRAMATQLRLGRALDKCLREARNQKN
jgi:hypothetical protein